jgi:hypothetical protein
MLMKPAGPDIGKSALVIVDMQNDFVHPDGGFAHLARERPATLCWEPEDHFVREITVAGLVAPMRAEPRLEAVDFNARVFYVRPCPVLAPSH